MGRRQRDWVGETITTANGTTLKIIDHNGLTGNGSRHTFYCPECAKDSEMFGDGRFVTNITNITHSGSTPCGCSDRPRRGEWGYYVMCKRSAIAKGLMFYGWRGEYKNYKTKVSAYCPDHGFLERLTINNLLNHGQGCRKCYDASVSERALSDEEVAEKYLGKCGYPEGATARRLDHKNAKGKRAMFEVFCPSCASDEFSQAGLCDGRFITSIERMCGGYRSCRCGETHSKPEKIARYQCESLLKDSGIDFLGWKNGYRNTKSKIIAFCQEHGEFYPCPATVLRGSRCPGCSAGGYSVNKPGFAYLLESECGNMMKVGISNNVKQRMIDLRSLTPFSFRLVSSISMSGEAAPVFERRLIKSHEPCGLSGFNGATEWLIASQSLVDAFDAHPSLASSA